MPAAQESPDVIRFGVFEVCLPTGELRKNGLKIKLQDQSFRVLAALLERPGQLVTRDELQKKLWSTSTFVDFEHGLNTAINKLREALGDEADNPRFIETIPRRGYRFIAPVQLPQAQSVAPAKGRLATGTLLGRYEIISFIDAGGMGAVYRARDSQLNRDVAVKVLPAFLAEDAERLRRFEQEARAAAALNHPNICTVHDIGSQNGCPYIVSELLKGETLRERLRAGAIPAPRAADYALQIARGLAAAHEQGIVHRDLKPENIYLTSDRSVKILDFGLAKLTQREGLAEDGATLSGGTAAGQILGTVGYMSPEQVRGQAADPRSDIFSLGLVLHEMLSGKRTFEAGSSADTMHAILHSDAPELPAATPPALRQIVLHCLEKEASSRFQSAQDLGFALGSLSTVTPAGGWSAPTVEKQCDWRWPLAALVAVTAICVILSALLFLFLSRPPGADLSRYKMTPLAVGQYSRWPAWSPDGRSLAYVAKVGDGYDVFVRALDSASPVQLTHFNGGALLPLFFSRDSRRVFFFRSNAFWSVSIGGGEPQPVFKDPVPPATQPAGDISPDGKTLALVGPNHAVLLSSPPGAPPRPYAPSPAPFEVKAPFQGSSIRFSPDRKKLLLHSLSADRGSEWWLLPMPPGSGKPSEIPWKRQIGFYTSFSWMPDSRRVVFADCDDGYFGLADTQDGSFHALTVGLAPPCTGGVAVSPDGRRLAMAIQKTEFDIVSVPLDGSAAQTLVAHAADGAWSPASPHLAFVADRTGEHQLWVKSFREGWERPLVEMRDFDEEARKLGDRHTPPANPAFSPDGMRVAYQVCCTYGIRISPVSGGAPPVKLTSNALGHSAEFCPAWSPDGAWIAFCDEDRHDLAKIRVGSEQPPIVVRASVSFGPGCPAWSPADDWIAFASAKGWELISPDGTRSRVLGQLDTPALVFSKDGKQVYGLRRKPGQTVLFAVDVASGRERVIGPVGDFSPGFSIAPGLRFSLAADGKSFVTTVDRRRSEIWMLEGFDYQPSLLERLGLRR